MNIEKLLRDRAYARPPRVPQTALHSGLRISPLFELSR